MFDGIIKLHATEATARQESLFAVGFAMRQDIGDDIQVEDILNESLFKSVYTMYVKSNKPWQIIYDFARSEPRWVDSVIAGVNKLKKHPYLRSGKYTIFRGMDVMNKIYNKKTELIKKDENIPNINNDKWNPGDVWLLKKGDGGGSIPEFGSLEEYNLWIRQNLIEGRLVSVSLKKSFFPRIFYISKSANVKLYTFGGVKSQESPFNTGITTLLDGKHGISNKTIGIRSFGVNSGKYGSNITSELDIKGSEARHGKTSLTDIISSYNIPQTKPEVIDKIGTDRNIENIRVLYNKLFNKSISFKKALELWDVREKKGEPIKNLTGLFRSIINSMEFGLFLKENKQMADEIVMKLVRDASSQGYWSSDFLKIM